MHRAKATTKIQYIDTSRRSAASSHCPASHELRNYATLDCARVQHIFALLLSSSNQRACSNFRKRREQSKPVVWWSVPAHQADRRHFCSGVAPQRFHPHKSRALVPGFLLQLGRLISTNKQRHCCGRSTRSNRGGSQINHWHSLPRCPTPVVLHASLLISPYHCVIRLALRTWLHTSTSALQSNRLPHLR